MKRKLWFTILSVMLLVGLASLFFVQDVKAATFSGGAMPQYGYAYQFNYDITIESFMAGYTHFYIYEGETQLATAEVFTSNGGYSGTAPFDNTWLEQGHTYSVTATTDYEVVSFTINSLSVTYTPYYLITVNSAYGSPTSSAYIQEGQDYAVSVTSPASAGAGAQYVCTGYSIDGGSNTPGTSYTFTSVSAAHTITFNWQLQYQVTYSATGLDATATGTIVTIDSATKTYSDLPFTKWVNNGASTSFSFASTVTSSTSGKQFRLYSSVSSPQTITAPTTITDGYTIQYELTISTAHSSGIGGGWYDAGSTAYAYLTATTVYDGDYTRYNFASWTGYGSGSYTGSSTTATITMNGPISETANWQTQYYLTVTGTYSSTTGSGWYNEGATANFNVSAPVSAGTGTQLAFSSWIGSGSGSYSGSTQASSCTMNAPITETVDWVTQYYLTVSSLYGTTSGSGWYTSGVVAHAGLTAGTVSGGAGTQYLFTGWSVGGTNYAQSNDITMSGPVTATASWSTQYYLTVTSAYSTTSGTGWYNAGATAYAGVATNVVTDGDGTHTFQGWTNGATGTSITSNPITMNSPKTALASWATTGSGGGGSTSYTVNLHGPFFEDGTAAADETILCTLLYANNTAYSFTMNSSVGVYANQTVTSTSAFVQLQWNASSALNYTRIYRFIANDTSDDVNLYIVRSTQPSFVYTFSVTDFYGMQNPYLESRISPDGINSYVVERFDLSEGGGTVTFILTQYQMYSLAFVCDQGTYTQSFTASVQGIPGQYPVSLSVLAGNFPSANTTEVQLAEAARLNATHITVSYIDPNENTSWVYVRIYHLQGTAEITDYVANTTGNVQLFVWELGDANINYYVYVEALSLGETQTWYLTASTTFSSSNPFLGLFDWLGQSKGTLPQIYTGWPVGMTSAQIAQLIGTAIIMLFLCVGSFRNAGATCIMAWIMGGIMLYLGWYQGGTAYAAIPEFALAGFLSILIAIDEAKPTVREF